MTLSYEDMLKWSTPPSVKTPSEETVETPIAEQPMLLPAVSIKSTRNDSFFWFIIGLLLGFVVGSMYESDRFGFSDGQQQVVPDDGKGVPDDKKQAIDGRDMIFITEIADNSSDTFEMDRLWDRIKAFAADKKVNARRYDKEQGSAQRYIEFAKGKDLSPPFIAFSKNGSITSVKSVKEMDAVLK